MRYFVIGFLATLVVAFSANAAERDARGPGSGAPNPPPSQAPSSTRIVPGMVGGTQQPGAPANPSNPSQAPSPSAPGASVVIPIERSR